MESALALWITSCRKKNIPLDGNIIHEKALKFYQVQSAFTSSSLQENHNQDHQQH